jgi:hypothetical protein
MSYNIGDYMTAARKVKLQHTVSYMITGDQKYLIMTNSAEVVDILRSKGIELRFENHSYHALVEELPLTPYLEFKKYQIKPISDAVRAEFETELQKFKDMMAAHEAMAETIGLQEELLTKMVKKKGLHLKPHLPNDSQMFSPMHSERLHVKQSLKTVIDQEAVEALMEKFPQLKKCFRKETRVLFDRDKFNKIQMTLPAEAINKIVSYNEIESLNYYDLEEWECKHCGGKYTKKGICKYCGIAKEVKV